ncbi:hypothetical protein AX14_000377 [Amanita brunnescens Koide BX004]|nr:hypothetical protein AX14_000377 [Amanita brunnescens Koide BX004]
MASFSGPPPGLTRPKSTEKSSPPSLPLSFSPVSHPNTHILSPIPQRAASAAWASSLASGLFPPTFGLPPQVPHGIQPLGVAVPSAEPLGNSPILNLAVYPAPNPADPWHVAHVRVCAHARQPCAGCSASFVCCSCRALRFTPGTPPLASQAPPNRRSRSSSPALFRNVGNGLPPPDFDNVDTEHDDDAYTRAFAEFDTCENSSCPRGSGEPATWTITVEQFDEGLEEHFDRTFRSCAACNRACKRSFLGHRIKSRLFDNSTKTIISSMREQSIKSRTFDNSSKVKDRCSPQNDSRVPDDSVRDLTNTTVTRRSGPVPGSVAYAHEHPTNTTIPEPNDKTTVTAPVTMPPVSTPEPTYPCTTPTFVETDPTAIFALQDALRVLNDRPPTPAAFVATVRVKHDAMCTHPVSSCPTCSLGLLCCSCKALFAPAVARHLTCAACKHIASSCCTSTFCCACNKLWMPSDAVVPAPVPLRLPARRFYGGAGSHSTSSPEPDIWMPSPRSSPDEIDDLTARANIPLPASRHESDSSRAPSRASSVDMAVNVAATPLPTPDYSALLDDSVDGFVHPSFPERAILDSSDKRHFLGRGDLAVTSLKLYARRIFTETSHWLTAGHFLIDIFQGTKLNGSRDDFRRFVILVGTQLGYGDLAQSMSESLDAKANSKDAKAGRRAHDELVKAREDITAILEEREVLIQQRREFLAKDDQLTTEVNRLHKDYGNAIEDNTKFAASIKALETQLALANDELNNAKNLLSIAEHHRDKAEHDCSDAVHHLDKSEADRKRDKAFYEARITALVSAPVPTSQPDSEAPLPTTAIDRAVLITRLENMKKELSTRDAALAKLRSEVSLSDNVNTLRAELAEAKAVAARLSGMYEQKSKDFRDSELERLALLGKQILADGKAPKDTPPTRPRPASRRGRPRSRSTGRDLAEPKQGNNRSVGRTDRIDREGDEQAKPATQTPTSSQPFWQDEPLFTKHVAAVTTATMSALPHLPFEAAIASAFTTVRNVGPPPPLKLDKKPGARRSNAPSPQTAQATPAVPQGNFTFADIAKAAVTNDTEIKRKPTWRAIETSKALVLRPSTKGTRVSELHLKVPKTAESADLFKLKGSALLERIAKLISDHSEPAPRMALRENPLVFVKWSMRGNLVLKCAKPMDDIIKEGIKDAIAYFFPSPSAEVMILNKPPTTALKFLAVPRHNLDGSDTDDMDLLNDLTAHPAWADIVLWSNPKFINLKAGMAGATVVVSVVDDNQGNVGRRLMGTMVEFSGCTRPCKRWVELPAQPFCNQCQSWGHPGARCPANVLICARCGGTHDFRQHDRYCDTCKKGPGHSCTPFCRNCRGNHMSTSHECPFWIGRTSKECHAELYAEIEAKFPKTNVRNNKNTTTSRKTSGRKKVGFSGPDAEGFIQVGVTPGITRIDSVPSGLPSPPPP